MQGLMYAHFVCAATLHPLVFAAVAVVLKTRHLPLHLWSHPKQISSSQKLSINYFGIFSLMLNMCIYDMCMCARIPTCS